MNDILLNRMIDNVLQNANAKEYFLQTLTISQSINIAQNEIIFVVNNPNGFYSYQSADEIYTSTETNRITQNIGFLDLTGLAMLTCVKLTITKYCTA